MDDILVIDGYNRLLYNDVYLPDYATTSSLTSNNSGQTTMNQLEERPADKPQVALATLILVINITMRYMKRM